MRQADGGEYIKVHRSQLKSAPYNPNVMQPYAAKGLRDSIKRTGGLVQAPVWNRRTGNIVGGHHRVAQTDALQGTEDYELTVCVVDLDEAQERALNIRLNNPNIQGNYDVESLSVLLRELADSQGLVEALADTGFDMTGLEATFIDAGADMPDWLSPAPPDDPELAATADQVNSDLEAMSADVDAAKQAEKEKAKAEEIDNIKARKNAFRDIADNEYSGMIYAVVVFPNADARAQVLARLGATVDQEYLDGARLASELGIEVKAPVSSQKKTRARKGQKVKSGDE